MDKRGILRRAFAGAILSGLFLAPSDFVSQIFAAIVTFLTTYACGLMLRRFVNPVNVLRRSRALATATILIPGCITSFALATILNAFA